MKTSESTASARVMQGTVMHGDVVAQEEVCGFDRQLERVVERPQLGVSGRRVRVNGIDIVDIHH